MEEREYLRQLAEKADKLQKLAEEKKRKEQIEQCSAEGAEYVGCIGAALGAGQTLGMLARPPIADFLQKAIGALFDGQYSRARIIDYHVGYKAALDDVRIILGGVSPAVPSLNEERAKVIKEIAVRVDELKRIACLSVE